MKITSLFKYKKVFLILLFAEMFSFTMVSNPGDTTWVTVWNLRKLTYYGNYDTTAIFPTGKRYRKIRLHYILGTYGCPTGSQYCASWDYTTQIYTKPTGKDTVEIARVITPYATDWLSQNKKHDYVVEVTDYASALEGTTGMRFNYSGYSWGFTITLKIEFIEGAPPMDALSVKNIYDGYFPFGNASNSIENYLTPKSFIYSVGGNRTYIKNTVSGHGSDSSGCSEFCSKYYQLKINNAVISQKQIWRKDCGINEVYPQTGTWLFERANWCPGAVVWPIYHDISSISTSNATYIVDIDMEPYVGSGSLGGYNFVSQLINYSAPNHSLDVSIEDIIAPTKDDNYYRENPACSNPTIKIKNVGTDSVKSIVFNYGLQGGTVLTHTWNGALGFLDETNVVFPPSSSILTGTASSIFQVSLTTVNGNPGDQNPDNNRYTSRTTPVPIYPKDFVVKMFTNKSTDTITGFNETTWKLFDQNGAIVAQRNALTNTTAYIDTIRGLAPGCYKISIDDSGCDGYQWWYYQYYTVNPGTGGVRFDYINAFNTIVSFPGDFGCNITKYFMVATPPNNVGLITTDVNPNRIDVFPNPSARIAYLKMDLTHSQDLEYKLTDIEGRALMQKTLSKITAGYEAIDVSRLSNGIYFLTVETEDHTQITKKLVVQN